MLKNYFNIAYRNMRRQKGLTYRYVPFRAIKDSID